MEIRETEIKQVIRLTPKVFSDPRGGFAELYNQRNLETVLGLSGPLVQDNMGRSRQSGTVRALHFQSPPFAQGKLVRVTRGAILDVAVDVRRNSPSYGKHVAVELNEESLELLWVPAGFAHGYVTLRPDTEVNYKTTDYYSPEHEVGIRWDDPDLDIDWGIAGEAAILSERDRNLPRFRDLESPF